MCHVLNAAFVAGETEPIARFRDGRSGDAPRGASDTNRSLKRSRLEHANDTDQAALPCLCM